MNRQITVNDLPVGRSVDETIRLIKAFQFTVSYFGGAVAGWRFDSFSFLQDKYGEVCPANWTEGSKTIKADPVNKLEYFGAANANGEANGAPRKRARVD